MQINLPEIISQAKQGDSLAFRKLVEYYQNKIYVFVFRMVCREDEARDIVQETFIKVWRNFDRYHLEQKFATWLFTIAARLCYDRMKSFRWQKINAIEELKIIDDLQSLEHPEMTVINSDLAGIIRKLTDKLTPKQKLVFVLRDLEELEVEEVICITGFNAEQIKNNLYLARKFIREQLEKM